MAVFVMLVEVAVLVGAVVVGVMVAIRLVMLVLGCFKICAENGCGICGKSGTIRGYDIYCSRFGRGSVSGCGHYVGDGIVEIVLKFVLLIAMVLLVVEVMY